MVNVDKKINQHNAGWSFENISESFDEHIEKSIPLYDQGHELICQYSDFFLKPDSVVYDIGCSTGQFLAKLARHHEQKRSLQMIGIDTVQDMIDFASKLPGKDSRISFVVGNALDLDMKKSDMTVANYTMQFLPPRVRQTLMDLIYQSLNWGGAFFMFEKVRAPDSRFQDYANQVYTEYKLQRGFSEAEIIGKARSIKGVMEPFSTQANIDMLKRSGFSDIISIQKYVCFEGFLAIK